MTLSIITTVNDTLKLVFLEGCITFLTLGKTEGFRTEDRA